MRLPFSDNDSPLFARLPSAIRFVLGFVQIAAVLAWPWLTLYLLDVTVPKGKAGFQAILLGCLFYIQMFVALIVLVMEVRLRSGFDPNDEADPVREAATEIRCQNTMLAVSAVFFAVTAFFNSHLLTRTGMGGVVKECGAAALVMWLLFVVAPPVAWFALNVWRWRSLTNRR